MLSRNLRFPVQDLRQPLENKRAASPIVTIAHPTATIIGKIGESDVEAFNAIPFAQPPSGPLRLKPPQPLAGDLGTVNATGSSPSCPQFFFSTSPNLNATAEAVPTEVATGLAENPLFPSAASDTDTDTDAEDPEDCLTLDVRRPAGTTTNDSLPVLVWIYGGAFELGSTGTYDGTSLVAASVSMDMPVIFVAMNYRVAGFGFMPGKEILEDGAANLGLLDQRRALEWVADNIVAFGGDPDKVTLWGESAGAISVFDQMLLYDGNHTYNNRSLFRGAIMNSGSAIPADPVDGAKGQAIYDAVVTAGGCSSPGNGTSLDCLRALPYDDFLAAANSVPSLFSYQSIALSYLPRPDGTVLTASPEVLTAAGKYARVPFIIGDQEDEGTIFALFQFNITTTAQIVDYLATYLFHNATRTQLKTLVGTYQDTIRDGSPFRTGVLNNWYPQFKRLAALFGDLTFTLTRRTVLHHVHSVSPDLPTWSYLSSYGYGTPILGTAHGSDIQQVFFGTPVNFASEAVRRYYFSFVYDLDPNSRRGQGGVRLSEWPAWGERRQLMNFFKDRAKLIRDDFRKDTYEFILGNAGSLHI
ncbi:extracellular lipase [Aspergillus keveii]|uniref:Carboxylic ester hydrolase n=1 Tax=Aspergillus keveii TaxID=714993 RepID=A0ABR4FXL3_9EURO